MTNSVILDDLARASTAVGDLIDQIHGDQWMASTPCTEWNVRQLVTHLVGINLVFVAILEEGPMPDRGRDPLGPDPASAYRRSAAALQAAATHPGALEQSHASAIGSASGGERLQWRITDLLAHAWDLTQATGLDAELPGELVEQSLKFAQSELPKQSRSGRFAEPLSIPDDAPPIERLAAFTGRQVPWPLANSTRLA